MKKSDGMNVFGTLLSIALAFANLVHSLFTYWICVEQIQTGWGYGTNWEMGILLPWMVEFLSIPLIIAAIVYFVLSIWKKSEKWVFILATVFFVLEVCQIALLNLFIFY